MIRGRGYASKHHEQLGRRVIVTGRSVGYSYYNKQYGMECYPHKGVVQTTPSERAIGRFTRVYTEREPKGNSQVDLAGDILFTLLKNHPQLKPEHNVPPERAVNRAVLEWAMENPDFEKARWTTTANLSAALAAAGLLWETLLTDETLKEVFSKQEEMEKSQEMAQSHRNKATRAMLKEDTGSAETYENLAKNHEAKAKEAAEEVKKSIAQLSKSPLAKGMMASAVQKAAQEAKDVASITAGWGLDRGGLNYMDADQLVECYTRNKEHMTEVSKMIGRFRGIASSAIEKTRQSYAGPVSEPAMTKDLLKIFPTERAYLSQYSPPYMRANKIIQLSRSGLLGWRPKSEGKREGGIVAMVDGSGSMGGHRIMLAKSIALGIARALSDDNRPYELVTFGSGRDELKRVNFRSSWKDHMQWGAEYPGGGTDFNHAFLAGIQSLLVPIGKNTGNDMLFITDGEAYLSDTVIKRWGECQKETGARLFYIDIANDPNAELEALADVYVQVTSASQLDKVADRLVFNITERIARERS